MAYTIYKTQTPYDAAYLQHQQEVKPELAEAL